MPVRNIPVTSGFLIVLLFCGCASRRVQEYPSSWPNLPEMSQNCIEIQGTYIDDIIPDENGDIGNAWAKFGIDVPREIVANRSLHKQFKIYFDTNSTLHVDYMVEGQDSPFSREFMRTEYECSEGGLELVSRVKIGQIDTKFPDYGRQEYKIKLNKLGSFLYMKQTIKLFSLSFYFIPYNSYYVFWRRYNAVSD